MTIESRKILPRSKRVRTFSWALAILALGIPPAYAYLDPGMGSMITQFVIAAFVAAALSIRRVVDLMKTTMIAFVQWVTRTPANGSRDKEDN